MNDMIKPLQTLNAHSKKTKKNRKAIRYKIKEYDVAKYFVSVQLLRSYPTGARCSCVQSPTYATYETNETPPSLFGGI